MPRKPMIFRKWICVFQGLKMSSVNIEEKSIMKLMKKIRYFLKMRAWERRCQMPLPILVIVNIRFKCWHKRLTAWIQLYKTKTRKLGHSNRNNQRMKMWWDNSTRCGTNSKNWKWKIMIYKAITGRDRKNWGCHLHKIPNWMDNSMTSKRQWGAIIANRSKCGPRSRNWSVRIVSYQMSIGWAKKTSDCQTHNNKRSLIN